MENALAALVRPPMDRPRRADVILLPEPLQQGCLPKARKPWLEEQEVRNALMAFALTFCGLMVFLY